LICTSIVVDGPEEGLRRTRLQPELKALSYSAVLSASFLI
jgi:hypothetical protein